MTVRAGRTMIVGGAGRRLDTPAAPAENEKGRVAMRARWFVVVCGAALASAAAAQPAPPSSAALVESMVGTARALLATMEDGPGPIERMAGYDRRGSLLLPFDDPNREQWVYWPAQRAGLPLALMTAEQRMLVHDLLLAALSSKGHSKVVQIMQLENILQAED